MTDNDNISKLYKAFSEVYDNFKSEDELRDYINTADDENIQKLYNAFNDEYDNFDNDFDGFKKYVGYGVAKPEGNASGTEAGNGSSTPTSAHVSPQQVYRQADGTKDGTPLYQYQTDNIQPKIQQESQQKTRRVPPKQEKPQGDAPLGPEKFAKQMEVGEMVQTRQKDFSQRMENIRKGNQPFSTGKVQRVNNETGKVEDVYLTKGGDEVATPFEQIHANREYDQQAQTRKDIESLSTRLDSMLEAAQESALDQFSNSEEVKTLTDKDAPLLKRIFAALRFTNNNRYTSQLNTPEVQNIKTAQRALNNANRVIEEADKHAKLGDYDNWFRGVGRGVAKNVGKVENWDFGLSSIIDNVAVLDALNKADNGEQLTESEQALLDATIIEIAANNYFGSEVSRGYKAGQVTADSLPFMLEMFINPASGMGRGVSGKVARYALKRFGKEAVAKGGKKYATATAMKIGGRLLGDVAGTAAITETTHQMHNIGGAYERMNNAKMNGEELDFGEAYVQESKANFIETYSEMLGDYFSPAVKIAGKGINGLSLTKFGKKVRLDKVMNFVEDVSSNDLAKIITDFEQHAQWHGTIGEYVEEVAGNVLNGIFVGDMTFDTDKDTGIFNLDNNIDTFLGVAVLGGLFSGVKTVGYGAQKINGYISKYDARKRMDASEMAARSAFGDDSSWEAIRQTLAEGNVGEVKSVLKDVFNNPDYSEEQKRAVFDYAEKATAFKGVLMSEQKRRNSADANDEEVAAEQSYDRGYDADEETRRDIFTEFGMDQEGDSDYTEKKAAWDGVVARINDEADKQMAIEREQGLKMKNPDGNIRPVTLKEKDDDGNDKEAFIIDGNVVMMSDGTMVDSEASDTMVVIYDPATGEKHQIPTSSILSVGEPTSWEDYDYELQRRRDEYVQKAMDDAQGTVRVELGQQLTMPDGRQGVVTALSPDGERFTVVAEDGSDQVEMKRSDLQQVYDEYVMTDYQERHPEEQQQPTVETAGTVAAESTTLPDGHVQGAPTEFLPDMEITIVDDEGNEQPAIILCRVRSENFQYVPDEEGNIIEYMVGGQVKHDNISDLGNKVVSFVPDAQTAETYEEKQPVGETAETVTEQTAEEPQGEVSLEEQPAVDVMPIREDGEADYMATTPERGHQFIYNEAGLSREEAGQFVKANIDAAEKELNKLKGKSPKMGTSITKYQQEKAALQQQIDIAQRVVDYWNGVKAVQQGIVNAEAAEREERDRIAHEAAVLAEQQRQAEELAKQKEQAQRGANAVHTSIREKWDAAHKVEGVENEITLADGETVKGRYMLVESGAATPSHNPNMEFARNEGFPVDENGQTVNDRDYERDQEAQTITRQMGSSYDSRAIQTVPVVSKDGVVLSGNGRTMAGELAAQNGTDGAYIEHLKKYPQQFGFTTEQVESMQHPRVVFVPDEAMPYTTDTFAKFNAQDMKSQSRTEQAVKLGKTVDDNTFGRIVSSINSFSTLGDFYNDPKASAEAIGELHNAGVVNAMQMAEMMDGEKISGVGRQMLENMLIGKAFEGNPDAIRQLSEYPSMRQSVVSALAEIANNIKLGEEYALASELSQAIDLAYQARKSGIGAGEKVSGFARQVNLFAFDEGDTVADYTNLTVMMLADCINDSRVSQLKKVLALYNDKAASSAAGQFDMFSGGIMTKEEIIKDVLNILNYGTEQEQQSALAGAAERRKGQSVQEDGAAVTGGAGSGTGNNDRQGSNGGTTKRGKSESNDVDENGYNFVKNEDGSTVFGEVREESGLPAAPIKLSEGYQDDNGKGYGLAHIEANHGKQIREAGFASVEDFVRYVAQNYDEDNIRVGKHRVNGSTSYLIQVTDEHDNTLFIELSKDNSYWNVNSGGVFRKGYSNKKETVTKTEPQQPNNVVSDGSSLLEETGIDIAPSKPNGEPTVSSEKPLKKGKLLYRFDGGAQTEQTQASASVTTSQDVVPGRLSSGKDTKVSETDKEKVASNSNSESVEHKEGDITYEEKEKDGVKTTKFTRYRKAKSGAVKAITGGGAFINPTLVNREYLNEEEFGQVEKVELIELREYNGEYGGTVRVYRDGYAPTILEVSFDKNPISSVQTTNAIASAEAEVDTDPTEGQKKAGNYKMGHVSVEGYDITIENPKGSVRRGTDPNGKAWEQEMHNTYGYIRGTEGVDGDHIDVFLSDDPTQGDVFVVDQVDPSTGKFDEHKVMYGFADVEAAKEAYLSNYEEGWKGLGVITQVSKEEFKKWVDSSHRKTKPFSEYSSVASKNKRLEEEYRAKVIGEDIAEGREFGYYYTDGGRKQYHSRSNTDTRIISKADYDYAKAHGGKMFPAGEQQDIEDDNEEQQLRTWFIQQWPHRELEDVIAAIEGSDNALNKQNLPKLKRFKELWDSSHERTRRRASDGEAYKTAEETFNVGDKVIYNGEKYVVNNINKDFGDVRYEIAKTVDSESSQVVEPNELRKDEPAGEAAGTEAGEQKSIFSHSVDVERSRQLRQTLAEAYRGGNREEIQKAVEGIHQYLDEGKDFDSEYSEDVEDYEGNDPEMLADRFITHALHDRYLDTDEDQGYIKTGIRSDAETKQQKGDGVSKASETEKIMVEALDELMRNAGIDVVDDVEEGQKMLDEANGRGIVLNMAKKRALETASLADNEQDHHTVVSSADGAKIRQNIESVKKDYENLSNKPSHFIGDVANALGAKKHGSNSEYATFETENGKIVTIRLADHNAKVSVFDNHNESEGISIVITPKANNGVTNDGKAHVVEFFYDAIKLRRAEGKPLVDIISSIEQALYSGEFKDKTGLAERTEVNAEEIKYMRAWHGSSAVFDAFDSSHFLEGEGSMAYGAGHYVTNVRGTAVNYAVIVAPIVAQRTEKYDELRAEIKNYHYKYSQAKTEKEKSRIEKKIISIQKNIDKLVSRQLYEVEIPDDNGSNYLEWNKTLPKEQRRRIADVVRSLSEEELARATHGHNWARDGWNTIANVIERESLSASEITSMLQEDIKGNSPKRTSEVFSMAGFAGIKVPTGNMSGGDGRGMNYVIFNDSDLNIKNRISFHKADAPAPVFYSNAFRAVEGIKQESVMEGQPMFFKTDVGEVYGFVLDGKMYIDPRIATSETPIHEYTHMWASALRKANPKVWAQLKKLMKKESDLMDYVKKKYPELKGNEDALMEEMFAHYSGKRGKERLDAEMKAEMEKAEGVIEKAKILTIFEKIKAALDMFWNMARDMFAGSVKGLSKMKAEDFADMAMNDLLNGFNPKSNNGIPASEQKTLMGVHNISEDKLRKAIKNGGYANPSVAVIDTRKGIHENYGDITLLPTSALVLEKQRGRNAGTWMADAWTPTYPQVSIQPGKGTEKIAKEIKKEWAANETNEDMKKAVERRLAYFVSADDRDHNEHLQYQFLKEKGMQPEVFEKTNEYDKEFYAFLQDMSKETGIPIPELTFSDHGENVAEYYGRKKAEKWIELLNRGLNKQGNPPLSDEEKQKITDEYVEKWKNQLGPLDHEVDLINRIAQRPEKETDVDKTFSEAEFTVNTSSELRKEYEQWLSALEERLGMEEKLFAGFTPSGSRRYVSNTLENASRLMNKGGQAGNTGWGGVGPFIAKVSEQANTLDKMRKNKGKLIGKDQGFLHDEARQRIRDEFFELSQVLNQGYGKWDSVGEARMEEIAGMNGDIRGYLKREYGVDVSDEWMKRYNDLVDFIRNDYPVFYFETKFNRPVGLWEFSNAIVPKDASEDIVDGLRRAGVQVTFYDKDVNGDRERVVNEVADNTGVKFHKAGEEDIQYREGDGSIEGGTTYEEGLRNARRAGYSKRQYDAYIERQERNARKQFADLIEKLGLTDRVEVRDTPEGLKGRRAKAKGWYDPTTGKIVIILGNHHSKEDVMKTILHESIGHYGMRKLFGTHFDTFLDNVYLNADAEVRGRIVELAKKHGWNFRTATEEYLASMAEDENFESEHNSWWMKIKELFWDMLHKLGVKVEDFGVKLSDNELRYLLWSSYQNLVNPGRFRSLVDEAKDVVMQNTLKVGQFEEESKTEDNEQSEEDLQIVAENTTTFADEAFNAQIDRLASGEMKSNEYITLGMPMGVLSNYMPNDRIILRQKIVTKAYKKHGISAETIKNLPSAISNPIFIFKSSDNTISVLTEIKSKDGNNVFVSIELGVEKQMGHEYLEVNDILTIHGRNVENIIKPIIENESLVYVNKEKARHWLSSVQANGQAVTKEELNSAAKILNNFDISEKSENDVLFRDGEDGEESAFGMESITSAVLKLAERHKEDVKLRNDAMQRISDNLSSLRKAISLQKAVDQGTVKRVTDLVNVFINNGLIDGMPAYEVMRILSAVKNSVGKEDIKENLNKVMDIMIGNQLKRAEETLHRLETVRGSKVDARGVEVQGELDIAGQRMVDAFKKGRRMQAEDLDERIEDVLNRMGSDDALEAEEASTEYAGLQMAKEYIDKIQSSINSEEELTREIRDEERKIYTFESVVERDEDGNVIMNQDGSGPRMRTVRHAKPEFKAPMSEANKQLKKQVLETVEAIEDAIRKGKEERVSDYTDMIGRLSGAMRDSMKNAKAFKESEQERVREIQHNADSDMEGRPSKEHSAKAETFLKRLNNGAGNTVFASLGTFVEMLRMFGSKSANGEGYLFNRFARGLIDSRQKEIRGVRDKYKQLDEKAREVFGGEVKRWADVMKVAGKGEKISVGFWDGGKMEDHELHQGNLMYIYMVNKMTDGRMKLRKMGVTEDIVEYVTEKLDPRMKTLADWIQDEFLPQSRKEYNETHKRMFGAPMASVENYFPLKILANARTDKPEDLDAPEMNDVISTKTGSIIKRKTNTLALDLMGADALHVVLDHVAEMEHWNSFAEYNRDLNTLRTYKHFRNQVQNMTSIYGNGKELWNKFNELCQIAVGSYRPKQHKLDKGALEFAQGVTSSKVSLRINTALKQFLSLPAYLPYINVRGFASSIASNIRNKEASFKWCMENLPMFEERWMSRVSGDPRLAKVAMDWKSGRANFVQNVARVGMLPNAFVDALTVSIGAHAVYETRLDQYIKEGYSREVAERRAIQDAEIAYNETQQSSEGGFVSTVQVDRTWLSVMFTIFRNASMAYQRQLHGALRNIWNNRTKAKREQTIEFEAKQLVRDGIDENVAKEVAKERFGKQMTKNVLATATFSFIVQLAWNLGGYMWYLLFGDDDDEKDAIWEDIFAHTLFGPFEGLVGGDVISELGRQILVGDFNPKSLDKDMPLSSDLMRIGEYIGRGDNAAALNDIINIIVSAGIGMNPQSITDAVLASFDICGGDMALTHEAVIYVSRVLQVPQSQVEKLYFDEIDLIGKDVSKYTFEQLIERYAQYKTKRGYLYTPWLWDDEEIIKKKADYMGKTVIKERTGMTMKQHEAYDKKRHQDIQAPNKDKDIDESYNKIADVYDELKKTDFAEKYRRIAMLRSGYEDAMKRSYVEAAQIMAELQTEEEKFHKENPTLVNFEGYAGKEDEEERRWHSYILFDSMEKNLKKIDKRYRDEETPEEEKEMLAEVIQIYKKGIVNMLNAQTEDELKRWQDKLNNEIATYQNRF